MSYVYTEDVRHGFKDIKDFKSLANLAGLMKSELNYNPNLMELKREVRKLIKKKNKQDKVISKRHYENGTDEYWELIYFRGMTVNDVNDLFLRDYYIELPQMIDCSSHLFTSSYKIFKLSDGAALYHKVSRND